MKNKETLEEAIDRIAKEDGYDIDGSKVADFVDGMVKGAKWQQEQIYNQIKELYDNENITGFSKRAYAQCLDIIEEFKNR